MFKKFILLSFLFIQLMSYITCACDPNLKCMHYGVLNTATCKCDCFPGYSGTYCETAQCSQQSSVCGTQFTSDMCYIDLVKTYCPLMCNSLICKCGIDSCLNGGIFDSTLCRCKCPTGYSGIVCESTSKCGTALNCLNNGFYNNNTCKCDCFQNYNGSLCENLLCNAKEPLDCSSFDKSYCVMSLIASYCPVLCGVCKTLTTTTTMSPTTTACTVTQDASSCSLLTTSQCTSQSVLNLCPYLCGLCKKGSATTTTSTTTIKTTLSTSTTTTTSTITRTTSSTTTPQTSTGCKQISCQNSGVFDSYYCRCSCPLGFLGSACDLYNCSSSLNDPVECSMVECSYPGAKGVCPKKCYCNIAPSTTTTACTVLSCQNSGVFDSGSCNCNCPTGYTGTLCEKFDCSSSLNDPVECSSLDCSISGAASYCPKKCQCSSCNALTCSDNGVFDGNTCSCSCYAGFQGKNCDTYNCNSGITDPTECTGIDCSISGVSSFCPQNCYCKPKG